MRRFAGLTSPFKTIIADAVHSDFKAEMLHDTAPTARLNVVLCEIAEENFRQAEFLAEKELENEPYGLFNTVTDGGIKSIYDYVKEFCLKKQ